MRTNEYFCQLNELQSENIHPEFHTFVTTWVRSRQPRIFKDLVKNYKAIEGEIYAQHECNGANEKVPF